MNIELVEKGRKDITIRLLDSDEGFVYLLLEQLYKDDKVEMAEYKKTHPYMESPVLYVRVSEGKPQQALKRAAKALSGNFKKIREEFVKLTS